MNDVSALYETDYYLWLQETYQTLDKKEIDRLDWPHLRSEILSLANEETRKVDSYLRQLLIHLLLYQYWESERDRCAKGWQNEIDNFRFELELLLESQTLYNYFLQQIEAIYLKARRQAIKKSELLPEIFPENCPFTPENLLDSEFLP
jgi:Domain of unknown function DUF29.